MYGLGNEIDNELIASTTPFGNVSNRYIATSSQDIINEINQYRNVNPVGFSKVNVRKTEREGSQKHMVMLDVDGGEMIDGNLRIVLFNSIDRSTSIRLYLGYYRDACANDCVFGDDVMEPIILRHTKEDWKHSVATLMQGYDQLQEQTATMINRMMNQYVSYGDIGRYTERVADMLNKDITGTIVDPMELQTAIRPEDTGKDAWHTYQRVQSNVMNGGIQRLIETDVLEHKHKSFSNTHKITNDEKKIQYNRELHKLAMEMVS